MSSREPLLIRMFRTPHRATTLTPADWSLLVRQARSAHVLGHALDTITDACGVAVLPEKAAAALKSEHQLAQHRTRSTIWEAKELARILGSIGVQPILLKGGAYLAEELPFSKYRFFGDIDILVPHAKIGITEKTLMTRGWISTNRNTYDQHYYRTWMHEVPPMTHVQRGTHLDLHHNITPLSSRYKVDAKLLLEATRPAGAHPELKVLAFEDMILHAAAHLFSDGESESAFRGLTDLRALIEARRVSHETLISRAKQLGLTIPLGLAARHVARVFASSTAQELSDALHADNGTTSRIDLLDPIYDRVFLGFHPSCGTRGIGLARLAVNLRGHFLRMPLHLLLPHLLRKALRSNKEGAETPRPLK